MSKKCGIYSITNKINNKKYIGSSRDIEQRFRDHKYRLRINKHCNDYLQKSWNKYGEENFEFKIENLCFIDELGEMENLIAIKYNSFHSDYGYNLAPINLETGLVYKFEVNFISEIIINNGIFDFLLNYDFNPNTKFNKISYIETKKYQKILFVFYLLNNAKEQEYILKRIKNFNFIQRRCGFGDLKEIKEKIIFLEKNGLLEINENNIVFKGNLEEEEFVKIIPSEYEDFGDIFECFIYSETLCKKCGQKISNYPKNRIRCKKCIELRKNDFRLVICKDCKKKFTVNKLSTRITRCSSCQSLINRNYERVKKFRQRQKDKITDQLN